MPAARPPVYHDGPLQDVRGSRVPPSPGTPPIPVPFRVAGGEPPTEFSTSMLALVRDERAAAQEIKNSVGELALQVGKLTTFFDPFATASRRSLVSMDRQELVSAFQEAFLTSSAAVVTAMNAGDWMARGRPGAAPGTPGGPGGPPLPPYEVSPASEGRMQRRPSAPGAPDVPGGFATYDQYRGMFGSPGGMMFDPLGIRAGAQGVGFDIGGIRSRIGGSLQRFVSQRQIGPDLVQDDGGHFRWDAGTGRGGEFASAEDIGRFQKAQKIQGGLQNLFGDIAGGEGVGKALINRLPAGAAAGLGVGAAVIGGTYMASNLIASQQAQNAEYQRALGGSNLEGMRERAQAQLFGWGNRPIFGGSFGGMGGKAAEELYMGTVQMGLRDKSVGGGFNRGEALTFGQNMYAHLGMSVDQSMEVMKLAAENGESSLTGVANALDRVSKSAHEAGVNAEEARQNFVSYYRTAMQGGLGPSAAGIAGSMANMQAQMGPAFAGMNLGGGISDPRQILLQSNAMGMAPGQYMAAVRQPGGEVLQGRALNAVQQPLTAQFLGQQGMAAIAPFAQQMKEYGEKYGTRNIPRAMWEQATTAAMQANPSLPLIAQDAAKRMFNLDLSPDEAIQQFIGVQSGVLDYEGAAVENVESGKLQREDLSKGQRADLKRGDFNAVRGISERIGADKGYSDPGSMRGRGHQRYENREQYLKNVGKTGMTSGIVETLLKNQPHDRKFRVETADGPRVVSLEDAMKYYYDQLASGEAEIVSGSGEGQTVADYTKMAGDPNAGKTLGLDSKTSDEGSKHGEKLEDFEKNKKEKGGDGRVEITAAPELAALLRFRASGSAYYTDQGRNNNTPPGRTVPASER